MSIRGFTGAAVVLWLTWVALCLGFWAAVVYAAIHFIMKVW